MRRILLLLAIAAMMTAMVLTSAIPAFAAALNPNANCYGYQASVLNQFSNGEGGEFIGRIAQDGGLGQYATKCAGKR